MFCGVNEAFDNPLSQQLAKYDKIEKFSQLEDRKHYSQIADSPDISLPYFNSQGDMENKGTPISELGALDSNDSLFDDQFTFDEQSEEEPHEYHVKKFIQSVKYDDTESVDSSHIKAFDHVKLCKQCKCAVKKELNKSKKVVENKIVDTVGYDIKDIIVVILIGFFVIFTLDIVVKIGRLSK